MECSAAARWPTATIPGRGEPSIISTIRAASIRDAASRAIISGRLYDVGHPAEEVLADVRNS
jgi:hypothetical protein